MPERKKNIKTIKPEISVIAPMFNESLNLEEFLSRTSRTLEKITDNWEIICVNDYSSDDTLKLLIEQRKRDSRVKWLSFSRNFGKEAALSAGLFYAKGNAIIPIDTDLQDPPEIIGDMVKRWKKGDHVVLAIRKHRHESWVKRTTALLFYKLIRMVTNFDIVENAGDYRLLDRRVVDIVNKLPERTRFMKGILAWPGFQTSRVYFDRVDRKEGESSWNYWKLWQFALDGIFSFTTMPLRIWTYVGAIISFISFSYAIFLLIRTLMHGIDVPGYASIMVTVLFIGGIQLVSLGIIGEYIGRIYRETKKRPLYVIAESEGITDDF